MVTFEGLADPGFTGLCWSFDIPILWVFRWSCHFTFKSRPSYLHLFTLGQPVMIRGGGGDCWSCENDYSYSDYVAMTTDRRTRR